ncbi:DUF1294 domain-containing protein [Flavobacterium limnosediminis]|uniref:DUF1294 domain-containing protein n=1 Tax=Flavobacterium limnosediminis TaxID=1401027 RepID=UPI00054D3726|nr:DUF1294 domain-containing protein [Flavobacterium limnosediminis]
MPPLFIYLLAVNGIAFLLNGTDKWFAMHQKSRISERSLLCFVLVGGTVGALLGMLLFRHKTSKFSFLWKFVGILLLQIVFVFYFLTVE